ncbi:MAG: hypothetical protein R6V51_05620 [Dehalococcoidia bacterium]
MEQTWKPITGGILCIIAGVINVLLGLVVVVVLAGAGLLMGIELVELPAELAGTSWLGVLGVPLVVVGIVSIVGGAYALKRRLWGFALAGAICSIMTGNLLYGTLAIIFISVSKSEFNGINNV